VDPKLQTRVQRYGWDLASEDYEPLWQQQLAAPRAALLAAAALAPDERVLDVACGTGLLTFEAARLVGAAGEVVGTDLSGRMIDAARRKAPPNVSFQRMDAHKLDLPAASFDAVLCSLGLMYVPDPAVAISEMQRVLRPGGRLALAVWGERSQCGWAPLFEIVEAEVASEVCPLFFRLGQPDQLAGLCAQAGLEVFDQRRLKSTLVYASASQACDAAFLAGPVALAWSRFNEETKLRVCQRYASAIEPWRHHNGYRIPGEFVIVAANRPVLFNSA
jgi:ubiquinone/menaquinone biosynthesis C-methylase UbiE